MRDLMRTYLLPVVVGLACLVLVVNTRFAYIGVSSVPGVVGWKVDRWTGQQWLVTFDGEVKQVKGPGYQSPFVTPPATN
jgi:hypothetical protein